MLITENSVMLRLGFSKAGNTRKADKRQIVTDMDKDSYNVQKVLFACEEYERVKTFDGDLSRWIQRRGIPCNIGFKGVCLLPLTLLGNVEDKLKEAEAERAELVESFIAVYETAKEEARIRLNGQFRDSDYLTPEDLRGKFGMRWSYVTFKVPDSLPPEIEAREKEKLEANMQAVEEEVRLALRETMAALVAHLADSLKPRADGKKKKFYDTTVENLVEFLDLFGARNVTRDGQLAELAGKAKALVDGVNPQRLRESTVTRERIKNGAEEINESLSALIGTAPRRKFNLED